MLAQLFEVGMLLAFGAAWPASIMKSLQARTARGKSIFFLQIVAVGYLCGICSKIAYGHINFVIAFYVLNLAAVCIDIALYYRNRRLDAIADAAAGGRRDPVTPPPAPPA